MPVLVDRIDPVGINCLIWSGRVSRADALGLAGRIDPARPEFGCRWISYFATGVDLSDLDAACLLELRERLRPVVSGLAAKGEFRMLLVSNSRYNDPLLAVWGAMTAMDPAYPSRPVVVADIGAAARGLGLSAADAEQARLWILARTDRLQGGPR